MIPSNDNPAALSPSKSTTVDVVTKEDQAALDELASMRDELAIAINNLIVSRPGLLSRLVMFLLALLSLACAVVVAALPYFRPSFPREVSTVAAFVSAVFMFWVYISLRDLLLHFEKRHLYTQIIKRAEYLAERSDQLLSGNDDAKTGGEAHYAK